MKKNVATMTVLGLLLTAVGVISPILWDIYKGRTELTLLRLGSSAIVERKEDVQELRVLYDNKPVESVTRASFTLRNSGRRPIVQENVRQPVRVRFRESILKYGIENVFPNKKDYTITKHDDSTLEVSFDLLNPRDFVTFSVLLAGNDEAIDANARIVGIKELIVSDASQSHGEQRSIFGRLGITGLIVLVFSVVSLLAVVFIAIPEAFYETKLKANWASFGDLLKAPIHKTDFRSLYTTLLFPKSSKQLESIDQALKEIEADEIASDKDLELLKDQIAAVVHESSGAKEAAIMLALLALVGMGYVMWRLVVG